MQKQGNSEDVCVFLGLSNVWHSGMKGLKVMWAVTSELCTVNNDVRGVASCLCHFISAAHTEQRKDKSVVLYFSFLSCLFFSVQHFG